jgi:hypothetical protein
MERSEGTKSLNNGARRHAIVALDHRALLASRTAPDEIETVAHFLLARLAIRSRLFPIGLDLRSLG